MTDTYRFTQLPVRVGTTFAVALALLVGLPGIAGAQTAAVRYERAQAQEKAARAQAAPATATLRSIATAYENIVRRYPTSGYTDNALWQAAGLMRLAYERSGDAADRNKAVRYLEWLRDEYPHSSLVRDARAAITELQAPPPAPTAPSRPAATPPAASSATAGGAVAEVKSVTRQALPRGDRIIIELTREVTYSGDRVDGPDRLFYDFRTSQPTDALDDAVEALDGSLVTGFRIGRHPNQVTRVVFDLEGTPRHSAFLLYDPFRLVIDLESADLAPAPFPLPASASTDSRRTAGIPASAIPRTTPTVIAEPPPPARVTVPPPAPDPVVVPPPVEAAPPAALPVTETSAPPAEILGRPEPPASTSRGDYSLARQLGLGISRIVIDAGHGGHDPGAQANGIVESELVLDIAHRLEALLKEHPGVDVVLTRTDNRFIPLEERTAIANRESADLFLSIHANASSRASTRGIETYVLNFATNEAAEEVAARENATSARAMGTLQDVVKTIMMNDKLAESRELATMVQTALVRSLRTESDGVRDLGVKQAPFVVLIGADMPSVLAEVSFLTNKPEATLLKTSEYRQRIAQALHDAVIKYQSSLKKITTVAPPGESR